VESIFEVYNNCLAAVNVSGTC